MNAVDKDLECQCEADGVTDGVGQDHRRNKEGVMKQNFAFQNGVIRKQNKMIGELQQNDDDEADQREQQAVFHIFSESMQMQTENLPVQTDQNQRGRTVDHHICDRHGIDELVQPGRTERQGEVND